jgi:hypothetical protein
MAGSCRSIREDLLQVLERLHREMSWLRDVLIQSGFQRADEGESEYLNRIAKTMSFATASDLYCAWQEWLNCIDAVAKQLFNDCDASFWLGRVGRTIVQSPLIHRAMVRDGPTKLLGNAAVSETLVCRPFRLRV